VVRCFQAFVSVRWRITDRRGFAAVEVAVVLVRQRAVFHGVLIQEPTQILERDGRPQVSGAESHLSSRTEVR
jgi:hypothetical protein